MLLVSGLSECRIIWMKVFRRNLFINVTDIEPLPGCRIKLSSDQCLLLPPCLKSAITLPNGEDNMKKPTNASPDYHRLIKNQTK